VKSSAVARLDQTSRATKIEQTRKGNGKVAWACVTFRSILSNLSNPIAAQSTPATPARLNCMFKTVAA
jgi:hypothetical protein